MVARAPERAMADKVRQRSACVGAFAAARGACAGAVSPASASALEEGASGCWWSWGMKGRVAQLLTGAPGGHLLCACGAALPNLAGARERPPTIILAGAR